MDPEDGGLEDRAPEDGVAEERGLRAVAGQVVRACVDRGWTLAVAESCTGGQAAAALTSIPGASRAFWGGIVVYSPEAKCSLAGLDPDEIRSHGVVSDTVTRRLAGAVRDLADADLGLAVTGWAGPDSEGPDPVGSVYLAVATRSQCRTRALHLSGSRARVRTGASVELLTLAAAEVSERRAGDR